MSSPLFEVKNSISIIMNELACMLLSRFLDIFTVELDSYISSGIINGKSKFTQNGAEQLRFNMKALFSFIPLQYKPKNPTFPKFVYFFTF